MIKREFRPENEVHYNRSGAVRWLISHALHYPWFLLIAILVLVRGALVDQGSHDELMTRCADYQRIFARYD